MNKKQNAVKMLLVILLFVVAGILILYPFIANFVFEHRTDSFVNQVEKSTKQVDSVKKLDMMKQAEEYNRTISKSCIQLQDPFIEELQLEKTEEYDDLLNMNQDAVMGIIDIPSIRVRLPIYHGTSKEVLEKGIGHLQGTSLPIGGSSTHSVLTGHTGLSNAKLFTDLVELEENDIFFLDVLGEQLAYKVDQIKKILPTELGDLYVSKDKDYCTLVTCTPYGINTHRLLVRGSRIDYKQAAEKQEDFKSKPIKSRWMQEYQRALLFSICVFIIVLFCMLLYRWNSRKMLKKGVKE